MSRIFSAPLIAVLSLGVAAPAALAEVTAEQVWSGWSGYMTGAGYELSATQERSGATLSIRDLTATLPIAKDDSTLTLSMGTVSFTENGDGTVSIKVPANLPIGLRVTGKEGEKADIGLNYATEDLAIKVSGDPADMTYSYAANSVEISLQDLAIEGKPVDMAKFGTAKVAINDVSGATRIQPGDPRRSVQQLATGTVAYLVDVTDPKGGDGHLVVRGGADGIKLSTDASLPGEMNPEDMRQMLADGFAVDGSFSVTGGNTTYNFKGGAQAAQGSSRTSEAGLRVTLNRDHLGYAGNLADLEMSTAGSDLPFPIDLAMKEASVNLDMPISAKEAKQDFAVAMTLGGFTMSDMLWGMVDPAGKLPHDPATLAFDISGVVRIFVDLFDPEQMAKVDSGEQMPGEIHALEIKNLKLSATGAELTGTGAFTFDNTDLKTFQGMPAPSGEVNLRLEGGNGLLDKLVAMGLVPEDQANGMRMMLGLFAVPAEGEDALTSRIEVKANGHILANGQRIQ